MKESCEEPRHEAIVGWVKNEPMATGRKAGQLGTDLNRDILWKHLLGRGIQGVRQIAIEVIWSAQGFRPAE